MAGSLAESSGPEFYRCQACETLLCVPDQRRQRFQQAACPSCQGLVSLDSRQKTSPAVRDWPLGLLLATVVCGLGVGAVITLLVTPAVRKFGWNDLDLIGFVAATCVVVSSLPYLAISSLTLTTRAKIIGQQGVILGVGLMTIPLTIIMLLARAMIGYDQVVFQGSTFQLVVFLLAATSSCVFAVHLFRALVQQGRVMPAKTTPPYPMRVQDGPQVIGQDRRLDHDALIRPLQESLRNLLHSAANEPGLRKWWVALQARFDASIVQRQYAEAASVIDEARRTCESWWTTEKANGEHRVQMANLNVEFAKLQMALKRLTPETAEERAANRKEDESVLDHDHKVRLARANHHEKLAKEWNERREKIIRDYPDKDSPVRQHLMAEIDALFTAGITGYDGGGTE